MGFRDLEPAAVDPSADGLVLVAEDGFHVLWGDDVGQVVPLIVEPEAEVFVYDTLNLPKKSVRIP